MIPVICALVVGLCSLGSAIIIRAAFKPLPPRLTEVGQEQITLNDDLEGMV